VENVECADFLQRWGLSHSKIKYISCVVESENKMQPKIIATYDVIGKDAKEVENYLNQNFKMEKLVFECCGWAPQAKDKTMAPLNNLGRGTYSDAKYVNPFIVFLSSGETIEKDWRKIKFKVIVETNFTEI
jgi:hypothetical protein